jgi:3-phenylpropionate/cinnamic acid dioxygenase small subunit
MREATIREVEQFLYREARLLDERRFHEWLELFTDDVRYWMAGRRNRYPKSSKAIVILDPNRYVEEDLTEDAELAILDENKQTLSARVARLDTGMAWAEDPPSRTRHLLANIEVEPGDAVSELEVYSNFIVYRSRSETEQDFYVGARRDVLRRVDGLWKPKQQQNPPLAPPRGENGRHGSDPGDSTRTFSECPSACDRDTANLRYGRPLAARSRTRSAGSSKCFAIGDRSAPAASHSVAAARHYAADRGVSSKAAA